MGKDPDRSGAADSRGESAEEPDEFDSLVLDEDFIAAGIPEASLTGRQRAIPGGTIKGPDTIDITAQPRRRPPDPFDVPAESPMWPSGSHHTRGQRRTTGILLAAAAVLVLGVALTAFVHLRTGLRGSTAAAGPVTDAAAAAIRENMAGLTPVPAEGACFNVPVPTPPLIEAASCAQPHQYELIGVEQASGRSDQYPAKSYWSGPIDDRCAGDLQALTGKAPADWPAGLHVGSLPPTPGSWASGDRTVYCIAEFTTYVSTALHQLRSAAAPTT